MFRYFVSYNILFCFEVMQHNKEGKNPKTACQEYFLEKENNGDTFWLESGTLDRIRTTE